VVENGSLSAKENERIYEAWFAQGPRYRFRAVDRRVGIRDKKVCDIGCAYGTNLAFTAPGSFGVELRPERVDFARSLGFEVYCDDITKSGTDHLPKAELAWCSAVLEHVDSPHLFLRAVYSLLEDGGLAVVFVPTIPVLPSLKVLPIVRPFVSAHGHGDHINAFTADTLRFTAERAGFRTTHMSRFLPGPLHVLDRVPIIRSLLDGVIWVGQKIPNWDYPPASTRRS